MVLSLLAALSMGLVHAETGGHAASTDHVTISSTDASPADHHHHDEHDHDHPGHPGQLPHEGPEGSAVGGGVPYDDSHHEDDPHHHHLVDVDAGMVLDVVVAAPHRAGLLQPVTVASIPASLSDGGGRPD